MRARQEVVCKSGPYSTSWPLQSCQLQGMSSISLTMHLRLQDQVQAPGRLPQLVQSELPPYQHPSLPRLYHTRLYQKRLPRSQMANLQPCQHTRILQAQVWQLV